MTEIITYRLSETGHWRYDFMEGRNRIGSAGFVVARSSPVRIEGRGHSWHSVFDMDRSVIPGTSRKVMDSYSGAEIYRLVFWQPCVYEVRSLSDAVQVEIRNGMYLFGKPLMPVTALTERLTEEDAARLATAAPPGIPGYPYFKTVVFEDVSDAYLMMALSFPALRFY